MDKKIKPEELRIGNILKYYIGEDGCEWDETTLDAQDIVWAQDKNENFNKVHKPVELTPERVLSFGFQVNDEKTEYAMGLPYGNGTDLKLEDPLSEFTLPIDLVLTRGKSYMYLNSIRYVHQLQNIVNALTKQDLTQTTNKV